jgi:AcrR family transcriptional regulator
MDTAKLTDSHFDCTNCFIKEVTAMTVDEKKNLKRANIIEAAYKLFTKQNINTTAIDEVVKAAGIAKGTFYLYFRDKYDLLDQLILFKSSELISLTLERLRYEKQQREIELSEQVIFFVDSMIDRFSENKPLLALMSKNLSLTLQNLNSLDSGELQSALSEITDACVERGVPRREVRNTLYAITDMVASVCCDSILYERPCPISEMKPILFSIIKKII